MLAGWHMSSCLIAPAIPQVHQYQYKCQMSAHTVYTAVAANHKGGRVDVLYRERQAPNLIV